MPIIHSPRCPCLVALGPPIRYPVLRPAQSMWPGRDSMADEKRPADLVAVGFLILLTVAALLLILGDMQGLI